MAEAFQNQDENGHSLFALLFFVQITKKAVRQRVRGEKLRRPLVSQQLVSFQRIIDSTKRRASGVCHSAVAAVAAAVPVHVKLDTAAAEKKPGCWQKRYKHKQLTWGLASSARWRGKNSSGMRRGKAISVMYCANTRASKNTMSTAEQSCRSGLSSNEGMESTRVADAVVAIVFALNFRQKYNTSGCRKSKSEQFKNYFTRFSRKLYLFTPLRVIAQ